MSVPTSGLTSGPADAFVPATLDHAGLAALIPHAGRMCLLDSMQAWDTGRIRCRVTGHTAPDHPLRSAGGLLAAAAIECAAQAMALHGALLARQAGGTASPGYLASARGVTLHRLRLDDLAGPLDVVAERQAGDARQILYAFSVSHQGEPIAEGRAAVVLDALPPALNSTPDPVCAP
ncbi:putative hotdog family 3-hydroxylacyl-ACP dehydratase [Sphaerotilus hippei]|uniref:Putative hotdog family 3-hydroxylacyl-ACP dehydratase n=1 Tax=Sphaerotilus hippei TaxID=744406 RepID=A0A318H212_9BURK|nr:hydroxymyristoyl-ACP dehydratase [Sphaerotilus hippei]PXW96639.1 putative hotdog family 3-hydroxylacyl-ACP dehydratase [Sphaerotilus hippei]